MNDTGKCYRDHDRVSDNRGDYGVTEGFSEWIFALPAGMILYLPGSRWGMP
jgi:hypothetical protein